MNSPKPLEQLLRKDRLFLVTGIILLALLSWAYIVYLYRQMYPMNMDALFFAMPMSARWTSTDFILLFLMWFVMMIAMMTPSVAPLVLIYAMVNRQKQQAQSPFVPAGYLLSGYFIVWAVFSLIATVLQWILQKADWLSADMVVTNQILGGIILITAGLFQFTTFKSQCLAHCRTPIDFIHKRWKEGRIGALQMGIKNGLYCLGCCWILMAVLFVTGIMNLLWIACLAFFVLLEKLLPRVSWVSYLSGLALIAYGLILLFR